MEKELYDTAVDGNIFGLEYYLNQGVDINTKNNCGLNLLMINLIFGKDNEEYINYLLENGIDINYTCDTNQNALHIATLKADLKMVKFLLESGIDINKTDENGFNALMSSCKGCFLDFQDLFYYSKIQFNDVEKSYLHILLNNWCKYRKKELYNNQYKIIELLLKEGINKNQISVNGLNAMDLLINNVYIRDMKYIDLLIENGIKPAKEYSKKFDLKEILFNESFSNFISIKNDHNIYLKKLKRIEGMSYERK